jgi:hypothetical protein
MVAVFLMLVPAFVPSATAGALCNASIAVPAASATILELRVM